MSEPRDEPLPEGLHERLLNERERTAPPPELRESVVETLRADGQIRSPAKTHPRRPRPMVGIAVAASLLLAFAAGQWFAGSRGAPPVADPDALFMMLLREPPGGLRVEGVSEADLVSEYSGWARTQAQAGRLVRGEKLGEQELLVGPSDDVLDGGPSRVTGFFLVRAEDLAEAERIARSCPHVLYGGTIELRPVDAT